LTAHRCTRLLTTSPQTLFASRGLRGLQQWWIRTSRRRWRFSRRVPYSTTRKGSSLTCASSSTVRPREILAWRDEITVGKSNRAGVKKLVWVWPGDVPSNMPTSEKAKYENRYCSTEAEALAWIMG